MKRPDMSNSDATNGGFDIWRRRCDAILGVGSHRLGVSKGPVGVRQRSIQIPELGSGGMGGRRGYLRLRSTL